MQEPVLGTTLPLANLPAVSAIIFCYKGLLSSLVAGKGKPPSKVHVRAGKTLLRSRTDFILFQQGQLFEETLSAPQPAFALQFFDLPSFLPLQPKQPFSPLA